MQTKFKFYTALLLISVTAGFVSCKEKSPDTDASGDEELMTTDVVENQTAITFEKDVFDFGEIQQGEIVHTEFKFTNTGEHALVITGARGSCGCTVPEWPREPIAPGASNVIKVQFNSKNKSGPFNKSVTVTANTLPSETRITIKGAVIVPEENK